MAVAKRDVCVPEAGVGLGNFQDRCALGERRGISFSHRTLYPLLLLEISLFAVLAGRPIIPSNLPLATLGWTAKGEATIKQDNTGPFRRGAKGQP